VSAWTGPKRFVTPLSLSSAPFVVLLLDPSAAGDCSVMALSQDK
jgi:hypothetical protein